MSNSTFIKQVSAGIASLVGLSSLTIATSSPAATLNGNVENRLNDWERAEDVTTQTNSASTTSTEANSPSFLSTGTVTTQDDFPKSLGFFNLLVENLYAVGFSDFLEQEVLKFLPETFADSERLFDFTIEWSAIKQELDLQVDALLSFDLFGQDNMTLDYAVVMLDGATNLLESPGFFVRSVLPYLVCYVICLIGLKSS